METVLTETPSKFISARALKRTRAWPPPKILLVAAVTLVLGLVLIRAWVSWRNDAQVYAADGPSIALAFDLRDGVFYRPLFGPDGYGATRYFPLYFVLHALLLKLGLPVLASAYLLSAAAIGLLLFGVFWLLRGLGSEPWLALCAAGATLAAMCVQGALLSPHPDGLACALNVCGLAAVVQARGRWRAMFPAALLFTLAWSAKITAVFGVAAASVWLASSGFLPAAVALAAETALGYLLVIVAMIAGSRGRVLDIFVRANASHLSPRQVLLAPWHLFEMARSTDPPLLVFLALAFLVLAFLVRARNWTANLPVLFFLFTLTMTAVILGYRGTVINHCLDAQVAAVILIAAWLVRALPQHREAGIAVFALAVFVAAIPTVRFLRHEDRAAVPRRFERTLAFIGDRRQPILAENALLPVLAGQRAYVIDPYMLAMVREKIPGYAVPLLQQIRARDFSAVVLCITGDPRRPEGHWWYDRAGSFGPGFGEALVDNYYLATQIGDQRIWLPKPDRDGRGAQP